MCWSNAWDVSGRERADAPHACGGRPHVCRRTMSKRSVAASRSGRSTGDGRRSTGTGRKAETATEQRSTRTTKRRIRGLAAFLVAAGLIVYGNSLWGVFIFDDQNSILGNPQIRRLWPLWNAFSAPANGSM